MGSVAVHETEGVVRMKEYIIKIDEDKKDIMGNCPLVEKPQELVRCKDCKKCDLPEEEPYEDGYCSRCGYVKMDWFCADGRKRDEDY